MLDKPQMLAFKESKIYSVPNTFKTTHNIIINIPLHPEGDSKVYVSKKAYPHPVIHKKWTNPFYNNVHAIHISNNNSLNSNNNALHNSNNNNVHVQDNKIIVAQKYYSMSCLKIHAWIFYEMTNIIWSKTFLFLLYITLFFIL